MFVAVIMYSSYSTVFVMGEFDVKCQPSGDDFYDFSRANFSVVNATEGHVRAGMQYDFTTK